MKRGMANKADDLKLLRSQLPKSRVKFCWYCGRRLWGNHHIEAEIDGHVRIAHKQCHKKGDDYYALFKSQPFQN